MQRTGCSRSHQPPDQNFPKKIPRQCSRTAGAAKSKMTYPRNVAGGADPWQPAPQPVGGLELSPDAARLLGPVWCPSGLVLGAQARAYVGDGWQNGLITATGCTWATITTTRRGRHVVRDRRNLLVGAEADTYKKDVAQWRRNHPHDPHHAPLSGVDLVEGAE
jgi:hypothetical protein